MQGFAEVFEPGFLQEQVNGIWRQLGVVACLPIQLAYNRFGRARELGLANQLELVAAVAHLDAQSLLYEQKVFVELPAQVGKAAGIDGLDAETMYLQGSVQNNLSVTSWNSGNHSIARNRRDAKMPR